MENLNLINEITKLMQKLAQADAKTKKDAVVLAVLRGADTASTSMLIGKRSDVLFEVVRLYQEQDTFAEVINMIIKGVKLLDVINLSLDILYQQNTMIEKQTPSTDVRYKISLHATICMTLADEEQLGWKTLIATGDQVAEESLNEEEKVICEYFARLGKMHYDGSFDIKEEEVQGE